MFLWIRKGIIEGISDAADEKDGYEVMDFAGFSLSPLFCDFHLHFSKDRLPSACVLGDILLKYGIGRVNEGGDKDLTGIAMQKRIGGKLAIRTSGFGLFRKGGYGRAIGKAVKDLSAARLLIDDLHATGVNYLKIINSGIFMPGSGEISPGGFERRELEEIITYAASRGLPVFCHANGDKAVRDAVGAGASAIIHGFSLSDETLSLMAERGTDFIPTVNALFSLMKVHGDRDAKRRIEALAEVHMATIKKAREKGIRVLPGSDSGPSFIPYGTSYHQELALFRKAGLGVEDILSAAVTDPLCPGGNANFLVLEGLSVRKVFLEGRAVS